MKQMITSICLAIALAAQAQDKSISGIVTTRLVQPDGQTVAFVLLKSGEPTLPVLASGADAAALLPRNQITLVGSHLEGAFGASVQVKPGSVSVTDTNQPFSSQPITAAAFKDAASVAGRYLQLNSVTFPAEKFDASGTAQVKAEDGSTVTLLVGKAVAGRETPKGATDVFGVAVKSGGEWKLAASRFLPVNRKEMQTLAASGTCITCHTPDTKLVGPAYREVAASYRNESDATDKLVAQMQNGGVGKWGQVPMPGLKGVVAPESMQKLADWVMSYRWDAVLAD